MSRGKGDITPFRDEGTVHVVFPSGEAYQATLAAIMEGIKRTETEHRAARNAAQQATLGVWQKQNEDKAAQLQVQLGHLRAALEAMQP